MWVLEIMHEYQSRAEGKAELVPVKSDTAESRRSDR